MKYCAEDVESLSQIYVYRRKVQLESSIIKMALLLEFLVIQQLKRMMYKLVYKIEQLCF